MPNLLAFDTSSDDCSVTLCIDGKLSSEGVHAPRKHAQILLPMIQSVLGDKSLELTDMDAIAFGCGPGSFTGLRIATGVAQGLAYGIDCPVIPISSLRAMALQAYRQHGNPNVLVALDARMDEVYWAAFEINESASGIDLVCLTDEHVAAPEQLFLPESHALKPFFGIGSGFAFESRFPESLRRTITSSDISARPHSEAVSILAEQDFKQGISQAPASVAPTYLRDEITWKKLPGRE